MTRIDRTIVYAAVVVWGIAAPAAAGTLGGPLELQDEGSFFIGGHMARSEFPGTPGTRGGGRGQIMIKQMSLQFRTPKTVSGPPIIMVHASGLTGVTYETSPGGREGW